MPKHDMPYEARNGLVALDDLLKRQDALLKNMKRDPGSIDQGDISVVAPFTLAPDASDDTDVIISRLEAMLNNPPSESDGKPFESSLLKTPEEHELLTQDSSLLGGNKRVLIGHRARGAIFYLALVALVVVTMSFVGRGNVPRDFLGYSTVSVLTNSMQRKIPQGSFVLIKHVDPDALQAGDDITYMHNATTSVTHEIVTIYENYNKTGQRGFQTKGVENPEPDKNIVPANDVVGKVVWHVSTAGAVLQFVARNVLLIMVSLVVIGVLLYLLYINFRWMFRTDSSPSKESISPQEGDAPSPPKFPSRGGMTQRVEVAHMRI